MILETRSYSIKDMVRGTQHSPSYGQESAILNAIGVDILKQMAGYIPPKISYIYSGLAELTDGYAICANYIMKTISNSSFDSSGYPHVPYLLLAWLLIGYDNPRRLIDHTEEKTVLYEVARFCIQVACGGVPSSYEIDRVTNYVHRVRTQYPRQHKIQNVMLGVHNMCLLISDASKIIKHDVTQVEGFERYVNTILECFSQVIFPPNRRAKYDRRLREIISRQALEWIGSSDAAQLKIIQSYMLMILVKQNELSKR
jgi:hypothetical protein